MKHRGNTLISLVALVIAICSLLISIATWRQAARPNQSIDRLGGAVETLAKAVKGMK